MEGFQKIAGKDQSVRFRMGIIDILTSFGYQKKMEYMLKICIQGKGISCVPPSYYSSRFYDFIKNKVFYISLTEKLKSIYLESSDNEDDEDHENDRKSLFIL